MTQNRPENDSLPNPTTEQTGDVGNDETAIKAAVLDRLLHHLDNNKDVQNIDLMILAGFCRNCLANWWQEAAAQHGQVLDKEAAREKIYGMPYAEWKARYQQPATEEQLQAFAARQQKQ
jgi:hypothetical protein